MKRGTASQNQELSQQNSLPQDAAMALKGERTEPLWSTLSMATSHDGYEFSISVAGGAIVGKKVPPTQMNILWTIGHRMLNEINLGPDSTGFFFMFLSLRKQKSKLIENTKLTSTQR